MTNYACKLCIMEHGLKGADIGKLPKTQAEFIRHLKDVHGLVVLAQDMHSEQVHEFEVDEGMFEELGFEFVPGYPTPFVRREALGAWRNKTKIVKVRSDPGDTRSVGARGIVLGSIVHPILGLAYFIEWDDAPKIAVLVIASKITAATP